MNGCIYHDDNGVQCERDPGHKGKHAYDLAMGGQHEWTGGLVPAARISELERAAETTRAEHAAALGLATARIRELEGERDELLGLFRLVKEWTTVPGAFLTPRGHFDQPCCDYGGCLCPLHEARAIVARIEKATKGTT